MTAITLKKVGDLIRGNLHAAEARGDIPGRQPGDGNYGHVRYDVRMSTGKAGPSANVTIGGYEWLIGDVTDDASCEAWFAGDAPELIAAVDELVGRTRWAPALGGATKLGACLVSARATTVRHVSSETPA